MIYNEFVEKVINPKTGFSTFLDKGYYTSEQKYVDILATASKNNRIVNELQGKIMTLKAYGVSHANTFKILKIYKPALKEVKKDAISSVITRWCIYYSNHYKELKRLIGPDWQVKAEQLIDFYIKNKDNPSISNAYLNQPVTIDACIEDIRYLLNRLLLFTQLDVPVEHNPKQLYAREQEIKEQINKCEDIEILNGFYAELISILGNKNESRRNFANAENYRAIRILKTCGFIEAAYKWLDCFPKK